jgi:hypothetical protein
MAKAVSIYYKRKDHKVVLVRAGGMTLVRESEPTATHCDFCATTREERTMGFFSYDDFQWQVEGIKAFCNVSCYLGYLASGRMTSHRQTIIKRALALAEQMEQEEWRRAQREARKQAKSRHPTAKPARVTLARVS